MGILKFLWNPESLGFRHRSLPPALDPDVQAIVELYTALTRLRLITGSKEEDLLKGHGTSNGRMGVTCNHKHSIQYPSLLLFTDWNDC